MKRTVLLAILLYISNGFLLFAQGDSLEFSMESACRYALEHNKALNNAREDIQIAEQQYKEARGQGLPQISGQFDYMTNFNYEATFEMGGGDGGTDMPQIDYSKLDAGDHELLKILEEMTSGSSSTIVMTDQSNAQVQVSQLIFGGEYWVGLKTAQIGQELARQNVNINKLDVKETVRNTYHLILVTENIRKILNINIENLEEIKEHTKGMYEAGIAEQTDVDQISINLSQLENRKKAMERNINLSYNMLRYQMGLDSGEDIILTDSLQGLLDNIEVSAKLTDSFNLSQNPNYQIVQTQEQLQEKQVDMQKWAFAPTLTGFYSYTEKIMTTGFDLSPNNAAGLNLNIPIFSSGVRKARLEKAKIELDKAKRSKQMLEEQLHLQNNQLRYELADAYENYETQKENVKVAQRMLKNIRRKYKQGLVSSLELTQSNANYLEAESNYLNATLELMQANLKLEKLYNQL
ncbi:MAG: TolC family protein [Bacteroidales bacterium]